MEKIIKIQIWSGPTSTGVRYHFLGFPACKKMVHGSHLVKYVCSIFFSSFQRWRLSICCFLSPGSIFLKRAYMNMNIGFGMGIMKSPARGGLFLGWPDSHVLVRDNETVGAVPRQNNGVPGQSHPWAQHAMWLRRGPSLSIAASVPTIPPSDVPFLHKTPHF